MYFDREYSREGSKDRVPFISPNKNTFRYSFTLNFTWTNNILEYEALLLGLKVVASHGIKNFHAIGYSK